MRKCGEWVFFHFLILIPFPLHFLILSPFPLHFLSIFSFSLHFLAARLPQVVQPWRRRKWWCWCRGRRYGTCFLLSPEAKTKTNRKLTKVKSPHRKSLIMMMVTTALVDIPMMILMVMIDDWHAESDSDFIGPRSDHSLPMSVTNWLTNWRPCWKLNELT